MPTFDLEVQLAVPSHSLWVAMAATTELFPKLAPQIMSDIEVIDGEDAEIDSIRHIKFGSNYPDGTYVKEKLIDVDSAEMEATTTEVEGGHLSEGFTEWTVTVRIDSIDEESCCVTISVDYEGGYDPQASIARSKEMMRSLFKGMEQYLVNSGSYMN